MKCGDYNLIKAPPGYPGKTYMGLNLALEHRIVWWQHHGCIPQEGEIIHHKNGNKRDNRIENLELMNNAEHARYHHSGPRPIHHGTLTAYKHHRCRCDSCVAENRKASKRWKIAYKNKQKLLSNNG